MAPYTPRGGTKAPSSRDSDIIKLLKDIKEDIALSKKELQTEIKALREVNEDKITFLEAENDELVRKHADLQEAKNSYPPKLTN